MLFLQTIILSVTVKEKDSAMSLHSLLFFVLLNLYINNGESDPGSYYKAGVVEYSSCLLNSTETPQELILRNADRYIQIIKTAASQAVDILVFPECGLTSIGIPIERAKIFPYLTKLPELGVTPCDMTDSPQVLKRLSCAAKEAKLYLVINIDEIFKCLPTDPGCPSDQSLFYNSNLVFDRNGKVISKYRKYNLFHEQQFNITSQPELSIFETDFGVKFGTFICFDILFKEPALQLLTKKGVTDIVYPTAWFSEMPFITAVSTQAAWSYSNNINLLASGYNNPNNSNTGSGIYAGVNGTLIAVMSEDTETKLLLADVPIKSNQNFKTKKGIVVDIDSNCTDKKSGLFLHKSNFTGYESKLISSNDNSFAYSNKGFECNIKVNYSQPLDGSQIFHRFVAFRGLLVVVTDMHVEICGIMTCLNDTLKSCGLRPVLTKNNWPVFNNILISIKSNKELSYFPVIINKELLSISTTDFVFISDSENNLDQRLELTLPHDDLVSFGIFRLL